MNLFVAAQYFQVLPKTELLLHADEEVLFHYSLSQHSFADFLRSKS